MKQIEIEKNWDVAKLLVLEMDYKMFLFTAPQYGLYVQSITPVTKCHEDQSSKTQIQFGDAKLPHIATVRTLHKSRISDFIQEYKEFKMYRIFKHGMYYKDLSKESVIGLICDATKNMLHLLPGRTFRIDSKNKMLRESFYQKAVQINKDDELGCSLDYDEYDYTLEIRPYKRFKDGEFYRWAVITILYGEDMPNTWNIGYDGVRCENENI